MDKGSSLPPRIAKLPRDHRGYPVPWFVQWLDGKPQFPVIDGEKWWPAINDGLCWVCGEILGSKKAFVLGPMCGISRASAEPPCHLECAEFSVVFCPFLSNPKMKRIDNEVTRQCSDLPGVAIKRNPGVAMVWVTKRFKIFRAGEGPLIEIGEPLSISLWSESRLASLAEFNESVTTGVPNLEKLCQNDRDRDRLKRDTEKFLQWVDRLTNWG